jgi:peptide chain release factor 2
MSTLQAEWGRQIRNYVFHPYKMVKDLRSGHETGNTTAVMDGDLDPFMQVWPSHASSKSTVAL